MIIEHKEIETKIEFDFFFFAEISQEKRLTGDMLERLEVRWNDWSQHLHTYELKNTDGPGSWFLCWLDGPVEAEIDAIWEDSPSDGLFFHSLAITMAMSAAKDAVPELQDNQCAPMPKPVGPIQDAFEKLGLEFNNEGGLNRKYAVFTHMPYKGGCEICFLEEDCPTKQLGDRWKKQ